MKRLSSIRNSLLLVAGQGLAQLASALTFVILARSLGVHAFGSLAALYGTAMFLSICVEFGSTNYLIRELNRGETKFFPGQYRSRLLITTIVVCASGILTLVFPHAADYLLCGGLAFILAESRYLSAPLRANLQVGRVAFLTALEKFAVLSIICTLSLAERLTSTTFFLSSLCVGVLITIFYRLSWSRRHVALIRNNKSKRFVSPFAGTYNMGISSVAIGLQSLDSVVIAGTAGPTAAGVYAAVGRWTQPLSLITQAVTQSAFAEMTKGRRHSDAVRSLKTHLGMLGIAAVPLIVVFIFADTLTLTLLGNEYESSTPVLRVLIGAVLFGIFNSPLSAFLQARADEAFTSRVLLVAMPTQLALMGLLALWGGAALAAVGVVGIQGALALTLGLRVRFLNRRAARHRLGGADRIILKPAGRHFSRR